MPSYQVPFVAHIKITPKRATGKRFEIVRELQRIAALAYDALDNVSGLTLALPGGGQTNDPTKFSDTVNGCAVKPQFGEAPAQLMVAGFYEVTDKNAQPHPDAQLIHAGQAVSGAYGAHAWSSGGGPTDTVLAQVKALKALLTANLTSGLPAGIDFSIFRLDFKNIIFGSGGHHFPR